MDVVLFRTRCLVLVLRLMSFGTEWGTNGSTSMFLSLTKVLRRSILAIKLFLQVLTYVAEVTQPAIRGSLSGTGTLCIIIGVTFQFLFGTFLHWRMVALYSSIVPIFSFILLFFIPESPYWLISKKKYKQAEESLAWLRGWVSITRVRIESFKIYNKIRKGCGDAFHFLCKIES